MLTLRCATAAPSAQVRLSFLKETKQSFAFCCSVCTLPTSVGGLSCICRRKERRKCAGWEMRQEQLPACQHSEYLPHAPQTAYTPLVT
jgi:hypothetical protein